MNDYKLMKGDCLERLREIPDNSVDAIVTDPPYGLGKEPDAFAMLTDWIETGHHDVKGRGFMGKEWDAFVPQPQVWHECLRVLKPGGHVLAFAGTRTQDLMTLGLRLAGFEIRDMVAWVYGSGFPKSLDVSKAIDKLGGIPTPIGFAAWLRDERERVGITAKELCERGRFYKNVNHGGLVSNWEAGIGFPNATQFNLLCDLLGLPFERRQEVQREILGWRSVGQGVAFSSEGPSELPITAPATDAAKQWDGWGTALKPALEPITLARKPLEGTVASNVLKWHTGALNIDGCRVAHASEADRASATPQGKATAKSGALAGKTQHDGDRVEFDRPDTSKGRWPANLIHDGSDEVLAGFPELKGAGSKREGGGSTQMGEGGMLGIGNHAGNGMRFGDSGSAARFFYCAKTAKSERGEGNNHPTVKPIALMSYLCRLITPPGGAILDPYLGSGSTGLAALAEGFDFIGIERDDNYFSIAEDRIRKAWEAKHCSDL